MKRLALIPAALISLLAFVSPAPVQAHDDPWTPAELAAVIDAEVAAHDLLYPPLDDGPGIQGFNGSPEYATNCRYTIRSYGSSAVGVCYNYSGSGSVRYQVAGLMHDGCRNVYWAYGSVGWVWVPGLNQTAKWSYVYSPPGKWYISYAKVVAWKP